MDYRKLGNTYYVRMDRGDEIISGLISICRACHIGAATFSGIGGCQSAEIQTFLPEAHAFKTELLTGMLELITINGNIVLEEQGSYSHHTHAMFAYLEDGQHRMAGGHMNSVTVLYTAEITLTPVTGGTIHKKHDPETGTGFWAFD